MTMKPHVQVLCDRLVANDPTLTKLDLDFRFIDVAEMKLILDATKENKVVKKVYVVAETVRQLSVHAVLSLASVVSSHPEIQDLAFFGMPIEEFGPIALAFHQNRKLTRLTVENCNITPNIMECLRWLLVENALESLTITDTSCEEVQSLDLSGGLLSNKSLKKLVLNNQCPNVCSETIQVVPRMLQSNQDLETISLILPQSMANRSEIVRLVAQAAEGHKSLKKLVIKCCALTLNNVFLPDVEFPTEAIGNVLQSTPALQELYLSGFIRMGPTGACRVTDGLRSSNLKKLELDDNQLGDEEALYLAVMLGMSRNLQNVSLRFNNIGDIGASSLAIALSQNHTLQELGLDWNKIGGDGACALADALCANDSLNILHLIGNLVGDAGATSIAEMLTSNKTIETIYIGGLWRTWYEGICNMLVPNGRPQDS